MNLQNSCSCLKLPLAIFVSRTAIDLEILIIMHIKTYDSIQKTMDTSN